MSTASLGARRVGDVMTALSVLRCRCARISASGQRRGSRRLKDGLAGDIVALSPSYGYPHLLVEVGGTGKRLTTAFGELRGSIMPGFAPLVVRFTTRGRWTYTSEDERFEVLVDALEALRGES